jgi:RNA polymerase sigma-70 factor (ECF subfamily)
MGTFERLRQQIARITGRADAEDLLQEALVRTLGRGMDTVCNLEAFLVRSARNQACDDARRARHPASPAALDAAAFQVGDPHPLPDEHAEMRQRLARVRSGIERLPARTREIFLMHRLDGMKYREIAAALGISQSAVEKHIARAAADIADWTADY